MNKLIILSVVFLALCISQSVADVYMHMPRGSNDRLNEDTVDRDNDQRLFDSENNAKGGYCWGPPLYYYVGSKLMVEWTMQHACSNPNVECDVVLQYMCGKEVRDGTTTTTIPDEANEFDTKVSPDPLTGENKSVYKYGMNEGFEYYQHCKTRQRNKGLFTADRNLGDTAIHTRQNNGGTRHGFECPEERDYYPYWHPTPWKDIAVFVTNASSCNFFQGESQNVKAKNYCDDYTSNNAQDCAQTQSNWVSQKSWGINPPDCIVAQFTRDNHLGNAFHTTGFVGTNSYNWTIPDDVQDNCVLRLRYNISTADYEGWKAPFADHNLNGEKSPVLNNPTMPYFGNDFKLAINTAQYGRTFQDRSYVFAIRDRPSHIPSDALIWNLGVRGKRGNIVQVYPAVEYDFVPGKMHLNVGDFVHFQWTGCDTNPEGNEGEGRRKTDRSNIAQIIAPPFNKPADTPIISKFHLTQMFEDYSTQERMAFIDQKDCDPNTNDDQDVRNCKKLNAAKTPYFDGGVLRFNRTGAYDYFSTRNNNFSNRSQKATITVTDNNPLIPLWSMGFIGVGVTAFIAAGAVAAFALYAKSHAAASAAAAGAAAV